MWTDEGTAFDILRAARRIVEFSAGMSREQFRSDAKTQSAVLHQVLVLGEAVKRLSPEFRQRHASLPWSQIAGMRDRCIHGYDNIDLEVVWGVIAQHAPQIIQYLEPTVPEPPPGA